MKLKALAAAVALTAVAGTAQASWNDGQNVADNTLLGDGEIALIAWSETGKVSAIQDLGGSYMGLYENMTDAAFTTSFDLSTEFVSQLSGYSDVQYSILSINNGYQAYPSYNEPARFANGVIVGAQESVAASPLVNNSDFNNFIASVNNNFKQGVADNTASSVNNTYLATDQDPGYVPSVYGISALGAVSFNTFAGADESLFFWALTAPSNNDVAGAVEGGIAIKSAGAFTLDFDAGTLSYAAAVPVPAAVWLFASGLLGLGAVSRRKKA